MSKAARKVKDEARRVAGVGSIVYMKNSADEHKEVEIIRMGPNPNITVRVTDTDEIVEVPISDIIV